MNEQIIASEWVKFLTDEEKDEAYKYLNLWEKFYLNKYNLKKMGYEWTEKKNILDTSTNTLSLKIMCKRKYND